MLVACTKAVEGIIIAQWKKRFTCSQVLQLLGSNGYKDNKTNILVTGRVKLPPWHFWGTPERKLHFPGGHRTTCSCPWSRPNTRSSYPVPWAAPACSEHDLPSIPSGRTNTSLRRSWSFAEDTGKGNLKKQITKERAAFILLPNTLVTNEHSMPFPHLSPLVPRSKVLFLGSREKFQSPIISSLRAGTPTAHFTSPSPIQVGLGSPHRRKGPIKAFPNERLDFLPRRPFHVEASEIRFLNHIFFPPHWHDLI